MADTEKITRVLPADVYDALELSAEAYGGIGAGQWHKNDCPICFVGHVYYAGISETCDIDPQWLRDAMLLHDDSLEGLSDRAVRAINARNGIEDRESRVSFADWCAELGIVRGSAAPTTAARAGGSGE
jgi:hypothetical protein